MKTLNTLIALLTIVIFASCDPLDSYITPDPPPLTDSIITVDSLDIFNPDPMDTLPNLFNCDTLPGIYHILIQYSSQDTAGVPTGYNAIGNATDTVYALDSTLFTSKIFINSNTYRIEWTTTEGSLEINVPYQVCGTTYIYTSEPTLLYQDDNSINFFLRVGTAGEYYAFRYWKM